MDRSSKPPSQTWRTFLRNHADQIAAIDFFTVPTITFRVLYCFLVLRHDHRRVVHFNVTANPTAERTAQQVVDASPYEEAPRYILRDRDSIYGEVFRRRVRHMGIEEVVTAYRSAWQNPYVERLIGSIHRECLGHVIVLSETHLRRVLASCFGYYHTSRPHLSLDRNAPIEREVDHRLGLVGDLAVGYTLAELLRQHLYALALGYGRQPDARIDGGLVTGPVLDAFDDAKGCAAGVTVAQPDPAPPRPRRK